MNVDATIHYKETVASLKALDHAGERAAMYALRAGGRAGRKAAQAAAPVYHGSDPRAVKGLLRRSIKSSRALTGAAGEYSMTVGPRGPANLYAARQEERYRYMQAGFEAAVEAFPTEFDRALRNVIERVTR